VWVVLMLFILHGIAVLAAQYLNMYNGKEGFASVAYKVICNSRKFKQSVSCGHNPDARSDKHIVRTDESVMQLLEGNRWLRSKAWRAMGPNRQVKTFTGVLYLICDGGYHRWPCLVSSPVKHGIAGGPMMEWSAKLESVQTRILKECLVSSRPGSVS
jgi:hypothetical protein